MQISGDSVAHRRPSHSPRSSFLQLHRHGGVRITGYRATIPCDIHGDFSCRFMSRLSHLPERWIAVIVWHRIVKPRLDDKLAALEDARHRYRCRPRRPRAWRDANAIIPNLTHPHANMPQDELDNLRVVDQRHGAHLVMTLGCHRDTAADQLPRPS